MSHTAVALCPVCGTAGQLGPGPRGRPNASCRRCGSLERHRALIGILPGLRPAAASGVLVDVAPSRQVSRRLRALAAEAEVPYVRLDFDPEPTAALSTSRPACTRLPLPDASVGLMICFHVLEHIPDDASAMAEIARVLGPEGVAVVQVPRRHGTLTDEDPEAPVEERIRRFGQRDHVRMYGDDFEDRLRAAGLKVLALTIRDLYGAVATEVFGIPPDEPLWLCTSGAEVDLDRLAGKCGAAAAATAAAALATLVADRDAAASTARRLDTEVARLRDRVRQAQRRARRAEQARRATVAELRQLRRRPTVRLTQAVARRARRWVRLRRTGSSRGSGRSSAPGVPVDEAALLAASPLFDLDWYARETGLTFASKEDAVAHYRRTGAARQLSPHPLFLPGRNAIRRKRLPPPSARTWSVGRDTGRCPIRAGTSRRTFGAFPLRRGIAPGRSGTWPSG